MMLVKLMACKARGITWRDRLPQNPCRTFVYYRYQN